MATVMQPEDLVKIADLAKIRLTDEEIVRYTKDLNDIVQYAQALKKVNTDGVEPMISPLVGMPTPVRDDLVKASLTQEEALKGALYTEAGHFKVPKTIAGD